MAFFTSSSVKELSGANSSEPVLPMVARASSVSDRPGICTRIWSVPWSWTVASDAPSAFTRLSMMARLASMSSGVMAVPSSVLAVSTTDRPPRMSRPWLIFSEGGVNSTAETTTSTVVRMSSQRFRRLALRAGFFLTVRSSAMGQTFLACRFARPRPTGPGAPMKTGASRACGLTCLFCHNSAAARPHPAGFFAYAAKSAITAAASRRDRAP